MQYFKCQVIYIVHNTYKLTNNIPHFQFYNIATYKLQFKVRQSELHLKVRQNYISKSDGENYTLTSSSQNCNSKL